jgi:hypothetical protein
LRIKKSGLRLPNKQPYLQATLELWQNLRRKTSKKKLVELKLMWSLSYRTYTCPACQTLDGVLVLKVLGSAINSSGKWRKNGTRLSTRPYRRNGVDAKARYESAFQHWKTAAAATSVRH